MKKFVLALVIICSVISLSAQIRTGEERDKLKEESKPKLPDWWNDKDIIFAPYDSSYFYIKQYPILDAYKKYIGQQLYLLNPEYDGCKNKVYSNKLNHDATYELPDSVIINKYYKVIDVLSRCSEEYYKHHLYSQKLKESAENQRKEFCHSLKDPKYSCHYEDIPYFVLQETQSGDTVYAEIAYSIYIYPDFILVGCFVKVQQEFLGQNIFNVRYNGELIDRWKVVDVVLRMGVYHRYEIRVIIQNVEDASKEKEYDYKLFNKNNLGYYTETVYNKMRERQTAEKLQKQKEYAKQQQQRAQQEAKQRQQQAQQEAKRKQELINKYGAAIADKILAGKYEIGMSKAACKEIAGSNVIVVDKTATTETWRVWGTRLYFSGNNLARITKY
jgi:DNA-binding protein H-NS